MLFFRSEELLNEWLLSRNAGPGALFTIPQLWELSQRWYQDRMSPGFHGRTMEQVQDIFNEMGLTDGFWQL